MLSFFCIGCVFFVNCNYDVETYYFTQFTHMVVLFAMIIIDTLHSMIMSLSIYPKLSKHLFRHETYLIVGKI